MKLLIDAYIFNACNVLPFDGVNFIFTVLNRNYLTINFLLAPVDDLYGNQPVPQPTKISGEVTTQFVFCRIAGSWTCINN